MDAHMHFDLYENRDEVLKYIESKKSYTIAVTNLPDLFQKYIKEYKDKKFVQFALGFHPELVTEYKNQQAIFKIAENYPIAVINSEKTIKNLLQDGLPGLEDTDIRNQWLCRNCKTFSNVYEAINYLESLKN